MSMLRMPVADRFGNYWFGKPTDKDAPAILTLRTRAESGKKTPYMLSLGCDGVVFDGSQIKCYASAYMALDDLEQRLQEAKP